MNREYEDPRVMRTRHLLREALMHLVEEKPFSQLSIKEITSEAGLDRSTFYLHYKGIHELMAELAGVLFDDLYHAIYSNQPPDFSKQSDSIEGYVETVFNHLEKHFLFYERVLGKQGDPYFIELFQQMLSELLFQPIADNLRRHREISSDMIIRFYCSGFIGVANWWLDNGMPIRANVAAKQITHDILPGYLRLVSPEKNHLVTSD